jgi:hypothetical protein
MRQMGVTCLVSHGLRPVVTDEPDALIGHVRVCGGSGGQPLLLPGGGRKITPNHRSQSRCLDRAEGSSPRSAMASERDTTGVVRAGHATKG